MCPSGQVHSAGRIEVAATSAMASALEADHHAAASGQADSTLFDPSTILPSQTPHPVPLWTRLRTSAADTCPRLQTQRTFFAEP